MIMVKKGFKRYVPMVEFKSGLITTVMDRGMTVTKTEWERKHKAAVTRIYKNTAKRIWLQYAFSTRLGCPGRPV